MTSFIISLAIRLTILLIAGGLVALAARRSTYAVRHVILASTLACVIILPATMRLIPEWRVGLLPAGMMPEQVHVRAAEHVAAPIETIRPVLITSSSSASRSAQERPAANVWSRVSTSRSPSATRASRPASRASSASSASVASPMAASISPGARDADASTARSIAASSWSFPRSVAELALAVWLFGVFIGLSWIGAGRIGLARVRRRATPLRSYEWRAILEAEAMHARVARPVALLVSPAVSTPVTWGILSPVIVLPEAALQWPYDRRRVVIMHEMAHIARRDSATQLMATLACVAYWIHPLVILAARRLRAECERACDERVLELGTPPTDYAAHLLDVAKYARSFGAASIVSVAMARPSQLEGRLLAVLRAGPRRGHASARSRAIASLCAAGILVAVSAFKPVAREAQARTTERISMQQASSPTILQGGPRHAPRHAKGDTTYAIAPTPPTPAMPSTPATPAAPAPRAIAMTVTVPAIAAAPDIPAVAPAVAAIAVPAVAPNVSAIAITTSATPVTIAWPAPIAAFPALRAFRHRDSTIVKSVSAKPGGTLELDLDTGGDVEITGTDDSQVSVNGSIGGRGWRDASLVLEGRDNGARLVTRYTGSMRDQSFDCEFTIRVPKHYNLRVHSAGGHLTINGVDGSFQGTTGGGEIAIDGANGDAELSTGGGGIHVANSHLDGNVSTGAGPVRFDHVTGGITGSSGFGDVTYDDGHEHKLLPGEKHRTRMERDSAMDESMRETTERARETMEHAQEDMRRSQAAMARAFEGMARDSAQFKFEIDTAMKHARKSMYRARIKMLKNFKGFDTTGMKWESFPDSMTELDFKGMEKLKELQKLDGLGDLKGLDSWKSIKSVNGLVMIDKDGGDIELDDAPHGARVTTGGGAIVIGRSKGTVTAHTGGGDIDITEADGAAAATTGAGDVSLAMVGKEAHPINVSSGRGDVELVLPKGANATLDLETAYTNNYGKHTKIKSDWPLNVTETDSWDSSHGTPRKYVRVRQDIGKGGPVIRVRTVNGDIRLKEGK